MFGFVESLVKSAVGIVVEVPVAVATDVVTLGETNATNTALTKVVENLSNATDPK